MKREKKGMKLRDDELKSDLSIIHHEPHIKLPPKRSPVRSINQSTNDDETIISRSQITRRTSGEIKIMTKDEETLMKQLGISTKIDIVENS